MKHNAMTAAQHLASYWAAAVHDYEHEGLNNDFLVKTAHPLAITYSDQSPLEHHHVAAATRVFVEPDCQYLDVSCSFTCFTAFTAISRYVVTVSCSLGGPPPS